MLGMTISGWEKEVRNRQEFRLQMVRSFGFTVMDHGVALTPCPCCAALAAVNSAFPDSDWNSLPHLISIIETYVETRGTTIHCPQCKAGFQVTSKQANAELWLWHSHYLAEVKRDFQVLIHRKDGRTAWVEGMLVDSDGTISPIALPVSEMDFRELCGCYFSVRQAWREFLKQCWPVSKFAANQVSEGYYLIVNPPVDDDSDLSGFKDNCVGLVSGSAQSGDHYEFADLSWADSWNFAENTYHQWLQDYETALEESDLIAGVLASPDHFFSIVKNELSAFDCSLRREQGNSQLAFLGDEEYYVGFDFREYLINAMVKGYSYWGALRYVEPIIDSWERAREVGERLKTLLKSYRCTVYGGRYFQCRPRRGKKIVKEFDLFELEESEDDVEDEEAFLAWIAPQIDLDARSMCFNS